MAAKMIYDRRELSFRRVGLHRDTNEPHFRSRLVREVNCLKWPVHTRLFQKFRMPFHFPQRRYVARQIPKKISAEVKFSPAAYRTRKRNLSARAVIYI